MGVKDMERVEINERVIANKIDGLLSSLRDKPGVKKEINKFFLKEVNRYRISLIELEEKISKGSLSPNQIQRQVFQLTDEIVEKGSRCQNKIGNRLLEKKLRDQFREFVGAWVYQSRILKRAMEKPRGYPGDYQMLEFIYDQQSCSKGIGYYFDHYLIENSYAAAVRTRKDKMIELSKKVITEAPCSIINILNLGCGACRDLRELFPLVAEVDRKRLRVSCVDQDEEAIEYSKAVLREYLKTIPIKFFQENLALFSRKPAQYQQMFGCQDLIYALGVADYLRDVSLGDLIRFCWQLLNSQGRLVIAHKDTDIDRLNLFPTEWLCEWKFYPRDKKKVMKIVKEAISGEYTYSIEWDKSRYIFFIILSKGNRIRP
jgi:hypothetical protein